MHFEKSRLSLFLSMPVPILISGATQRKKKTTWATGNEGDLAHQRSAPEPMMAPFFGVDVV